MKSLSFEQMENVTAGGCGSAIASAAISLVGLCCATAAIAATTGPIGFAVLGGLYASLLGTAVGAVDAALSC